ncbi:MAG: ABC transporter ATP-binding protein, partial [Clostridia bacterium]|nr:ABC transporter ATP-binding protein [Clostridia bacterium]
MLRLFRLLSKKEWLFVLLVAGFVVLSVWLDLKLPSYMSEITEKLYTGASWQDLMAPGGMMLLCAVCSGVASVVATFFVAQVAGGFGAKLRESVYKKVLGFSQNEINKFSTSSLITRTTNDITQIQMLVSFGLVVLVRAPVTAIWALSIILTKSWQWTALVGGAVLAIIIAVTILIIAVLPKYRKVQTLTDNLNRASRENLNGMRVVRAFNAEKYQEQKFEKANTDITNNELFINKSMAFMLPFMSLLSSGLSLGIYWLGAGIIQSAGSVAEKATLFGDMVVFMSYAMQLVISFIMLIVVFIMLPRALVASKRINEVLNTNSSIVDGSGKESTAQKGKIEFVNVAFKYPNAENYILKDINF